MRRRLLLVTAILVVAIAAAAGLAGRTARTDGQGSGRDGAVESRGTDNPATATDDEAARTRSTPTTSAGTSTTTAPAGSAAAGGAGDTGTAGSGDPGPPPPAPGDVVLLYTDGLTEGGTRTGGLSATWAAAYHREHHHLSAEDLCQGLLGEAAGRQPGGSLLDDQTVLVLRSALGVSRKPPTIRNPRAPSQGAP